MKASVQDRDAGAADLLQGLDFTPFLDGAIFNSHFHFEKVDQIAPVHELLSALDISRVGLVSYADMGRINCNPQVMAFKAAHPTSTYILGALDYLSLGTTDPSAVSREMVSQLDRLCAIGFDGVKLLETKPTAAMTMPFEIDDPVYDAFFGGLEDLGWPVCWHVADPEEFWKPGGPTPDARERGWDYSEGGYASKESLYRRVANVLDRHPRLTAVFAHFYFLSADLARAGALLDKYPNVHLDITPGSEMYRNFSAQREAARAFFLRYQDRLIFGDDSAAAGQGLDARGTVKKVHFMRRFLETDETFAFPKADANFLTLPGTVTGLRLEPESLAKLYSNNYVRLAGNRPRALDRRLAREECDRLSGVLRGRLGFTEDHDFAAAARELIIP